MSDESFQNAIEELRAHLPSKEQREAAAYPQRLDQLEDATMNLARITKEALAKLDEIERTLVANNIHPPMPGYPSPADKEA